MVTEVTCATLSIVSYNSDIALWWLLYILSVNDGEIEWR